MIHVKSKKTYSYKYALYFKVNEKGKTYNYYLQSKDCGKNECPVDAIHEDVTKLIDVDINELNDKYLFFNDIPAHQPGHVDKMPEL